MTCSFSAHAVLLAQPPAHPEQPGACFLFLKICRRATAKAAATTANKIQLKVFKSSSQGKSDQADNESDDPGDDALNNHHGNGPPAAQLALNRGDGGNAGRIQ